MSERVAAPAQATQRKPGAFFMDLILRLIGEKPLGTVGAIIVLILFLVGIFANFLAPYGMNEMSMAERLSPPSATHLLGTDNLGRDLMSRIIYGARISMIVGLGASSLSVSVSGILGIVSGFLGGKIDMVIQRFVDAWMCFPSLVILLTILSITGPGLVQVIMVLGLAGGITGSRVTRSAVIGIKENVYVEAARAIGSPWLRTLVRHIFPNVAPVIIVLFTVSVGGAILAEASLSFLGFGIPPPTPSWGGMISGVARSYVLKAPWMILWPGLALAIVVYGANMLGDALRDLLDPKLRGGLGRYTTAMPKRLRSIRRG